MKRQSMLAISPIPQKRVDDQRRSRGATAHVGCLAQSVNLALGVRKISPGLELCRATVLGNVSYWSRATTPPLALTRVLHGSHKYILHHAPHELARNGALRTQSHGCRPLDLHRASVTVVGLTTPAAPRIACAVGASKVGDWLGPGILRENKGTAQ